MPKPAKKPRQKRQHRDMPDDPRLLAQAMFEQADRKIEEGKRPVKKAAAQGR